jgi:hypothetical protein
MIKMRRVQPTLYQQIKRQFKSQASSYVLAVRPHLNDLLKPIQTFKYDHNAFNCSKLRKNKNLTQTLKNGDLRVASFSSNRSNSTATTFSWSDDNAYCDKH